jgi:peptidoglycan/xylan/chitin deacetylase (PgdA/CDA1 family)
MPIALLYHDVVVPGREEDSGFPGPGALRYKLAPEEFAAHLDAIARTCEGAPLLTFDDGGASALEPTALLLEGHGWHGLFFITTDCVGRRGFLDSAGIRELRRRGHRIGSHSCSHPPRLSACPRGQVLDEWRRSRAVLEDLLGEAVTEASVPGGWYSRGVALAAAEAGITTLYTSEPTTAQWSVAGCRVRGRYTVYRGTPAATAAALATGRFLPRFRQALLWQLRKAAKTVGGGLYLRLREKVLARKYAEVGEP